MIRIVTDSTGYLPEDIVRRYHIPVVPLKVQFGAETYAEITGISNHDFYRRLATSRDFPTTSQPAAAEFKAAYQQLAREDPAVEILVLTISSKLSGTYNAAKVGAAQVPDLPVTVFDSLSAAMGLGLMVIQAAEMALAGRDMATILDCMEKMRREVSIVLVVDTLEYLRRGGRIGPAAAFLGNLLNTKPILGVIDGSVQPLDRVRTKQKAIDRLLAELLGKLPDPGQPVHAGVMHVAVPAEMDRLVALVQEHFKVVQFFTSELGPVVGAHLGPGALGAGICPVPIGYS